MSAAISWTADVSLPLDFAVRVLERDGLRVRPFDIHAEGDGSVRALGLDAESWTAWVRALVGGERVLTSAAAALEIPLRPSIAADRLADKVRDYEDPWTKFPDIKAVRDRLADLWSENRAEGMRWRHAYMMTRQHDLLAPEHHRRLSRALQGLGGVPHLSVLVVRYSSPVVMVFPPDVCVVGRVEHDRGGRAYSEQIETGARALAAQDAGADRKAP